MDGNANRSQFPPNNDGGNTAGPSPDPVPNSDYQQPAPSAVFSPQPVTTPSQPYNPSAQPQNNVPDYSYVPTRTADSSYNQPLVQPPVQPLSNFNAPPVQPASIYSAPPTKRSRKKLVAGLLALLVIVGGASGYAFGYYLPNKPEHVWATGLNRTGQALDGLVTEASSEDTLEAYKNTELVGSIDIEMGEDTYSGSINAKYGETASDSTFKFDSGGTGGVPQNMSLELLTDQLKDNKYPDVFFKYTGFSSLGADEYLPGLSSYDGKWISVTSQYLESIIPEEALGLDDGETKKEEFSHKDAAEIADILSKTTQEHVMTSDTSKSVLVRKSFVGAEDSENGNGAYHYKVGLSKTNAKAYCKALVENIMAADAYKRIPYINTKTIEADKKSALESCDTDVDKELNEADSFDMWIDKKYKLIHKVRVADKEDEKTYVELGQNFDNGDEYPMFMNFHSDADEYDGRVDLITNRTSSNTKATVTFKSTAEQDYDVKAVIEFKPHDGMVTIEKPVGAAPLADVLKALGIDPMDPYSSPVSGPAASGTLINQKSEPATPRAATIKSL